jgi:hypothetical protein
MTSNDHEWNSLPQVWQSAVGAQPAPTTLSRLIASERRRLAIAVVGEVLVVAAFVAMSWLALRDGLVAWEKVWLTTLWLFTAVAAPFAWWNRRGAWTSMVESVAEFERRRTARRRRTLRFGVALFVTEILVVWIELAWFDRFGQFAVLTLGAMTVVFVLWVVWMKRR